MPSRRLGPDGQEYALSSSSLSSSLWVSKEGRTRRLYHDTQMWSSLLPPRLRNGCSLCLSTGVSLEGEVERAWSTPTEEEVLQSVDPSSPHDDETRVAVVVPSSAPPPRRLPLAVLSRAREHDSLPSLAASFDRTERWTLSYLCRGVCASPHALASPLLLSRFVPPQIWTTVWSLPPRMVDGALSPLVERVRLSLSGSDVGEEDLLFDRVRLTRLARRAEEARREAA